MNKNNLPLILLCFSSIINAQIGPGGVTNNLEIWVKADKGTGTTTDYSTVYQWTNQLAGGVDGIATPVADNAKPVYRTAENVPGFNFNPSIEIVSTNSLVTGYKFPLGFPDNFTNALTSYTHHTRGGTTNAYRVTFVMNGTSRSSNPTDNPGGTQAPWFGTYGSRSRIYNQKESGAAYFGNNTIASVGTSIPSIHSYYNDVSNGEMMYFFDNNAIPFGSPLTNPQSTLNYPGMVLVMDNSRGASARISGDRVGEFILYSETQTPETRQKINSYLAVKYGVTLGNTTQPVNYLNSTSVSTSTGVIWTGDNTYQNNVFGIGRDNNSELHQRISTSIDPNGRGIVVLSTDTNFTNANTTHTNIPINLQFTMVGDNGGGTSFSTPISIAGKTFSRMNRIWKVQDTGDMNCINVQVKTNVAGNTITPSAGSSLYFIIAENANFTTNVKIKKVPYNSTAVNALINFKPNSNSNYFTLATLPNNSIVDNTASPAPFGISTGSGSWVPTAPNTYMELRSKNLGLVVTRVTTAARNAISMQKGMLVYDTDLGKFYSSDGVTWRELNRIDTMNQSSFCD